MKISAQSFISDLLKRIEEQNRRNDYVQTANSVTLKRRNRDYGQEDNFGVFSPSFSWTPITNPNYYSLNVIKRMVAANTAAMVSANVRLDIEPRFEKDSKSEMVADVARAVLEIKEEEQWTAKLEEKISSEPQLAPGVFIRVKWDDEAQSKLKSSVAEWVSKEYSTGKAVCPTCGYESEAEGKEGDSVPCEYCGGQSQIVEEVPQQMDMLEGTKDVKPGNSVTDIIPAAEVCIDEKATQGGDISKARWMLHRHLESIHELPFDVAADYEWSFPIQWQHALLTNRDSLVGNSVKESTVDENVEVKDLYLTPAMYKHIELEDDVKVGDFSASKGKGFADGKYKGKKFDEAPVLCFRVANQKIQDIYPCDFREEFIYISFLTNPASFWGLYLTEMLSLQDIINYMLTIWVFHTRRNARSTLVLNRASFDLEDVEKDVVMTREDVPYDIPIPSQFGIIPPTPMSPEPINLIQTLMAIKGDIGGVTPAMTGGDVQGQGYDTFSGQLLAKNQSMAQLSPFAASKANAKVKWGVRQLKEAQEHWTEEDFLFLLKLNGEWTEEHIEAFLDANLDTDLIMGYREGSEIPTTLIEREMQLRQFMQDVFTIQQLQAVPLNPQVAGELLTNLKRVGNIDIDIDNTDAETRLADTRYDRIKELIANVPSDPTTNQAVAQQIVMTPELIPYRRENHPVHVEFYTDKIRTENSKDEPNQLLITCLDMMITLHMQATIAEGQQATADQLAVQQPAIQMQQQQMAQEQLQQQAADEDARESERSASKEDRAADENSKNADFAREIGGKAADAAVQDYVGSAKAA